MNISEIKAQDRKVDVTGTITAIGKPREVNLKAGGTNTIADATLEDATGKITVPLWGDDIAKFRVGDKVQIAGGYVTSYKGVNQLSVGRFGKISRLG